LIQRRDHIPWANERPSFKFLDHTGQNILTQNGLWNVDWSLNKITNINERFRIEFRLEAFNVFNHPTFASGISGNSGTDTFGRTVTAGEPRRLQLALKFHF
jgi:hypothetical protein